jgi:hypothetical protein
MILILNKVYDWQSLNSASHNQHPVEGITMQSGKSICRNGVFKQDRQYLSDQDPTADAHRAIESCDLG